MDNIAVLEVGQASQLPDTVSQHLQKAEQEPGGATVFQSRRFLMAFAKAFARDPLWIWASNGDAAVVGAFELTASRGMRMLRSFGHELIDYTDISASSEPDELVDAFAEEVLRTADVLDLGEVRGVAEVQHLISRWPGPLVSIPVTTCSYVDAASWDEFVLACGRRGRFFARERRRAVRQGVTWTLASPAEAADELLRLHRLAWRGRAINPVHETPAFSALVRDLCQDESAEVLLMHDTEGVFGALMVFVDDGVVRGWLEGFDPQRRGKIAYSLLEIIAIYDLIPGVKSIDFMRGAHAEKTRFAMRNPANRRVLLLNPSSPAAMLYGAAVVARAQLRAAAPEPLRHVAKEMRNSPRDGLRAAVELVSRSRLREDNLREDKPSE